MKRSVIIILICIMILFPMSSCSHMVYTTESTTNNENISETAELFGSDVLDNDNFTSEKEIDTSENSEPASIIEHELRKYEFPFVGIKMTDGEYIEIPEIRWHIWLSEEKGSEPLDIEHLPMSREGLSEVLKNTVAEVIVVPKELSPLYTTVLKTCLAGGDFFGEDDANYFYCNQHVQGVWLNEKEFKPSNDYQKLRKQYYQGAKGYAKEEDYIYEINPDVTEFFGYPFAGRGYPPYNQLNFNRVENPNNLYMATILDEEWVTCVQSAKEELLNNPEKYKYPKTTVETLLKDNDLPEYITLIETEEMSVVEARAQMYGEYKAYYKEREIDTELLLEDFIVLRGIYEENKEEYLFIWLDSYGDFIGTYRPDFYVDIVPSIEYYQQLANLENDKLNITEYTDLNACGLRSIESDYSNNDIWLVNTESGECEKLFPAEEDDY